MGAKRWLVRSLLAASLAFAAEAWSEEPKRLLLSEAGGVEELLKAAPMPWKTDTRFASIVRAMAAGYPKDFTGLEFSTPVRVLLANGRSVIYDDGKTKTFEQMLDAPDLEDMFSQVYPLTNPTDHLPENFDPGRIRIDAMFQAIFGDKQSAVSANCEDVDFCGNRVRFSQRCGAADALRKVSKELTELFAAQPELKVYAQNLGGTFNWRKIAGTERLSNHSFGAAIDLNVDKSAYWRWQPAKLLPTFSRRGFPQAIIEAFERHDFIWGGKWYHYDTMHFEYRPELIAYAREQATVAKK